MYNTEGALTRLRLRKDYPEPGDACLVNFQEIDGSNQEYMQILRNEDRLGRIRVDAERNHGDCRMHPVKNTGSNWVGKTKVANRMRASLFEMFEYK